MAFYPPEISIIIPMYDTIGTLERCLRSVSGVVSAAIEVILVDDASTDGSAKVGEEVAKMLSLPYKMVRRQCNGGLSEARNSGIFAATGRYLYFLDGDDEIIPKGFLEMASIAKRLHPDMVVGAVECDDPKMRWLDIRSHKAMRGRFITGREVVRRMMMRPGEFPITTWNKLVRRDIVTRSSLYFKNIAHEDEHWHLLLCDHIQTLSLSLSPSYRYHDTAGSIMHCTKGSDDEVVSSILLDYMLILPHTDLYAYRSLLFRLNYRCYTPKAVDEAMMRRLPLMVRCVLRYIIRKGGGVSERLISLSLGFPFVKIFL